MKAFYVRSVWTYETTYAAGIVDCGNHCINPQGVCSIFHRRAKGKQTIGYTYREEKHNIPCRSLVCRMEWERVLEAHKSITVLKAIKDQERRNEIKLFSCNPLTEKDGTPQSSPDYNGTVRYTIMNSTVRYLTKGAQSAIARRVSRDLQGYNHTP